MESSRAAFSFGPRSYHLGGEATLVRDLRASLPLTKVLTDDNVWIVMLVPTPATETSLSPYQALAEAIARKNIGQTHLHYYTPRGGFTGVHTRFVRHRLCKVVIVVVHGPILEGQKHPLEVAETALVACGDRTHIILAFDDIYKDQLDASEFPTIVRVRSLATSNIEAAADLLFGQPSAFPPGGAQIQSLMIEPKVWPIETIYQTGPGPTESDFDSICRLWNECLPPQFALPPSLLGSLLWRDGFAKHYVVREPGTRQILGFCATYYSFADGGGDRLVGCLAVIAVTPACRKMGIGLSLHNHALQELKSIRGVYRLKLGSIFPRLLFGIPLDSPFESWFRRRGWRIDEQHPDRGGIATDWMLSFDEWHGPSLPPAGLTFRRCQAEEFSLVAEFVAGKCFGKNDGWYDEYTKLQKSQHFSAALLALEDGQIVATAIAYPQNSGLPVAEDLPWASIVGQDFGAVCCICIAENDPAEESRRTILSRLLIASVALLAEEGAKGIFADALKDWPETMQSLGFQAYAKYRDAWREV